MTVYFVGAGPGDPELLTIKAHRILQMTQCCVWTGSLVNPDILDILPESATVHDSARLHLDQIVDIMAAAHTRGETVVRLHTGDPSLYGAIGEQMTRLADRGIPFEVVPGISAFSGAAAALQKELTRPGIAQSVVLTRMPGRTPMPQTEQLETFAQTGCTLCLYLSADRIGDVTRRLLPFYGADCPVAIVYRATWPDEQIIRGTLSTMEDKTAASGICRTALIVVGRVLCEEGDPSKLYDATFSHGYRSNHQ